MTFPVLTAFLCSLPHIFACVFVYNRPSILTHGQAGGPGRHKTLVPSLSPVLSLATQASHNTSLFEPTFFFCFEWVGRRGLQSFLSRSTTTSTEIKNKKKGREGNGEKVPDRTPVQTLFTPCGHLHCLLCLCCVSRRALYFFSAKSRRSFFSLSVHMFLFTLYPRRSCGVLPPLPPGAVASIVIEKKVGKIGCKHGNPNDNPHAANPRKPPKSHRNDLEGVARSTTRGVPLVCFRPVWSAPTLLRCTVFFSLWIRPKKSSLTSVLILLPYTDSCSRIGKALLPASKRAFAPAMPMPLYVRHRRLRFSNLPIPS